MHLDFLYPEGKLKALTFSYDDGEIYDRKLIDIFNQYGMKATFHLNSGNINKPGYVTEDDVKTLYEGHEIASHGVEHLYMRQLSKAQLVKEVWEDRKELERMSGRIVQGMSYAFGQYSNEIVQTLECLGIKYCRGVYSTSDFALPDNFITWQPTCHHSANIMELAKTFLNPPEYMKLPLYYIWGHSFEYGRQNNWEIIENFCKETANKDDVWYATNIEIYNYVMAMRNLVFNAENTRVFNPSSSTVWIKKNYSEVIEIAPGVTTCLE